MANVNSYRRDLEAETAGRWRDLKYGVRMKLARIGNPEYLKAIERLKRQHREQYPTDESMPDELRTEIARRAFCETIVRDWNLVGDDGQAISYTPEEGFKLLSDPELSDLEDDAVVAALNAEAFRKQRVAVLSGNSESGSAGTSSEGREKSS